MSVKYGREKHFPHPVGRGRPTTGPGLGVERLGDALPVEATVAEPGCVALGAL